MTNEEMEGYGERLTQIRVDMKLLKYDEQYLLRQMEQMSFKYPEIRAIYNTIMERQEEEA